MKNRIIFSDYIMKTNENSYQLIGGVIGLSLWLALLEGPKMKGVLFRQDSEGNMVFTPHNVINFIKAPFKYSYFWTPDFFTNNWILMTSVGITAGYLLSCFL